MKHISNLGILIQARESSSRLPGKVLLPFSKQLSILEIIVERLRQINFPLVILTGSEHLNSNIISKAKSLKVEYFAGDELNVLKRFVDASEYYSFNHVLRICSDNPFINLKYIIKLIDYHLKFPNYDYISYQGFNNIPVIKTHIGLFGELVNVNSLLKTLKQTSESIYLEHVTNYIYTNPFEFSIKLLKPPCGLNKRNDFRLTIDDLDDFNALSTLYNSLKLNEISVVSSLIKKIDAMDSLKKTMQININKYTK